MILFQGSTWLTELLTSRKYPEYVEYKKRVNKFLPKLGGQLPGDFSDKRPVPERTVTSEVFEKNPREDRPAKHPAVRR